MKLTREMLARTIDHTLLKPDATSSAIETLCREAAEYGFAAVCVNPCRVAQAARLLSASSVAVASVVGFPLGATTTESKRSEARGALEDGASEIDMVANIGALKDRNLEQYKADIAAVVGLGATTKVIIETCLLNEEEISLASTLCVEAGAHFVKTSTGFSAGGAKASDVRLIRKTVGERAKIKASGGIKTFDVALEMMRAGADRLGTSSGVAIMEGFYEVDL